MSSNALKIDELVELFESLKVESGAALKDALEVTIQRAKLKGLSSSQLQENLNAYGIKLTALMQQWVNENY